MVEMLVYRIVTSVIDVPSTSAKIRRIFTQSKLIRTKLWRILVPVHKMSSLALSSLVL